MYSCKPTPCVGSDAAQQPACTRRPQRRPWLPAITLNLEHVLAYLRLARCRRKLARCRRSRARGASRKDMHRGHTLPSPPLAGLGGWLAAGAPGAATRVGWGAPRSRPRPRSVAALGALALGEQALQRAPRLAGREVGQVVVVRRQVHQPLALARARRALSAHIRALPYPASRVDTPLALARARRSSSPAAAQLLQAGVYGCTAVLASPQPSSPSQIALTKSPITSAPALQDDGGLLCARAVHTSTLASPPSIHRFRTRSAGWAPAQREASHSTLTRSRANTARL